MPNWCECSLTLDGPAKDVETLMAQRFTAPLAAPKPHEGMRFDLELDFEKVIPYPNKFRDQDEVARKWEEENKGKKADWSKRPKDGFNSGGYEWCTSNWGVKWPPSDFWYREQTRRGHLYCYFKTPWGPPEPVIQKLSELHPGVRITLRFWERGMAFRGIRVYKGGKVVREEDFRGYNGMKGG